MDLKRGEWLEATRNAAWYVGAQNGQGYLMACKVYRWNIPMDTARSA